MPGSVRVVASLNPHATTAVLETPMVEIEHLALWYGDKQALRDVSMSVPKHRVTAYIGPSGCGKSTLLRCLNRMNDLVDGVRITGSIRIGGTDVYDPGLDVTELRKRVGMVFQKSNPFPKSIYENVAYGPRILGVGQRADLDGIVERSLRGAALWDEVQERLNESALGLSGGQQQRLCIARAIAVEPDVLLMDEPCSALDPIATARIEELMLELKNSYTIVIVTHNMQQAARVSDYTGFMLLGELVEFGVTRELFTNPRDRRHPGSRASVDWRRLGMQRHFHEELEALKQTVLAMGGLVEDQIRRVMTALLERDDDLAREVIDRDRQVNAYDVEIDEKCVELLALHQPAAGDLRVITTAMKIVTDLERIGDQAVNIAQRALELNLEPQLKPYIDLPRMAERAQRMVKESLDAFVARDTELARRVCAADEEVDALKEQIFRELLTFMMGDARTIPRAIRLILISRFLERVADHATNIAEMVIYMVESKMVRHTLA